MKTEVNTVKAEVNTIIDGKVDKLQGVLQSTLHLLQQLVHEDDDGATSSDSIRSGS